MHIYWRVIEELKYLGEGVSIHDPCLSREYRRWLRGRAVALDMLTGSDPLAIPMGHDARTMLCSRNQRSRQRPIGFA